MNGVYFLFLSIYCQTFEVHFRTWIFLLLLEQKAWIRTFTFSFSQVSVLLLNKLMLSCYNCSLVRDLRFFSLRCIKPETGTAWRVSAAAGFWANPRCVQCQPKCAESHWGWHVARDEKKQKRWKACVCSGAVDKPNVLILADNCGGPIQEIRAALPAHHLPPSTRLRGRDKAGQEILPHSRLHMKYRATQWSRHSSASFSRGTSNLHICVKRRYFFPPSNPRCVWMLFVCRFSVLVFACNTHHPSLISWVSL